MVLSLCWLSSLDIDGRLEHNSQQPRQWTHKTACTHHPVNVTNRYHCIRNIRVACRQYEWLPFPSLSHEETPRLDTLFAFPPNEKPPNEGTSARQQRKTTIKHPPSDPRLLASTESPHRKPSCLTQTRNQYTRLPYHPFVHRREGSSLTIDRHETPSLHHSIHQTP
jgi:hypothetical protein